MSMNTPVSTMAALRYVFSRRFCIWYMLSMTCITGVICWLRSLVLNLEAQAEAKFM